jgi:hypothetical protein
MLAIAKDEGPKTLVERTSVATHGNDEVAPKPVIGSTAELRLCSTLGSHSGLREQQP